MLISLVSIKGGSGKTTWAREWIALLNEHGLLEKALDLNPENGDLAAWCQLADIPCRSLYPGDLRLLEQAARASRFYVADCPPWEGPETAAALAYSVGVIVPVGPSLQDLRGLGRTLDLVRVARADVNPDLRTAIIGTNFRPNTGLWRGWAEAIEVVTSPEERVHLAHLVQQRQALVDAYGKGTAASRLPNAAGAEIREALSQVARILEIPIPGLVLEEAL